MAETGAFGELLKRYRREAGLTQEELAEKALISARAISDLERGVNRTARRDTLRQLAEALGLSPEQREALDDAARGMRPVPGERPADPAGSQVRTFLIVDLRDYTSFSHEHGDAAAAALTERFADLVERTVEEWEGRLVELRGDEAMCVFFSARQALHAAVELLQLLGEDFEAAGVGLKVGIGLDAGEAIPVKGGYRGRALNLAARLCGMSARTGAARGEIFASEAIIHLAGRLEGLMYVDRGEQQVKGLTDPVRVIQVTREGSSLDPSRSAGAGTATPLPSARAATPAQAGHQSASASDTFLMADIRGWFRFISEHGEEAAMRLADRFGEIVEEVVPTREGRVVSLSGDDAFTVFPSADCALRAAMELQERFTRETSAEPSLPLRVGIGLETGGAIPFRGSYVGASVDLAARYCTLAGAGEVLVSEAVRRAVREVDGLAYVKRGLVELRGIADPVKIFQVVAEADRPSGEKAVAVQEGADARPSERPLPLGRFLGSLPSSSLVARKDEFGSILAAGDAVREGEGRLIVLAGEPGAGKTRLAQEAMLVLRNLDFLVATGRCYEPEQSVPYYPFLDALAKAYRAAPPAIASDAPQRWPYLGWLLPDVGSRGAQSEIGGRDEQQLLFRSVTGFLESLAENVPVALMLDDLHWADEASLRLLLHLARRTCSSRVLLLGTYRDIEIGRDHPLERGLLDLGREGLGERVAVRRLDEAATGALIADIMGETDLPQELIELVYGRTDGNPFFVQQVLRTLVERGEVYREDGRWLRREVEGAEVPESVRGVIRQRVRRLPEETQEALREASVLGQMFRFDDLQRLGERNEEDLEAALEKAGSVGLVREAGGDVYAFDHVLTQQALYADLSARRKRKLHLAAGRALEQLPEYGRELRAAELAYHFLEGEDPERALPHLLMAGDRAEALSAQREAEQHYRKALQLAREIGDIAREAESLEKLAGVLKTVARHDEALAFLERAALLQQGADDLEAEGRVVAKIVHALREDGRPHSVR